MTATDELRKMLDERGVEWYPMRDNGYYEDRDTEFFIVGKKHTAHEWGRGLCVYNLTPAQAIAATLGNKPTWRNSEDDRRFNTWLDNMHNSKPADFIELIEEIIWTTCIVDMGPNGNTCQGVDEGEVMTYGLVNYWADLAATLESDNYKQAADYWHRMYDEHMRDCVGRGECEMERVKVFPGTDSNFVCWICSACGRTNDEHEPNYCPNCGKEVNA